MPDDLSILFSFLVMIGVMSVVHFVIGRRAASARHGFAPGAADTSAGAYFYSPSDGTRTHIPTDDSGAGWGTESSGAGVDCGSSVGADGGGGASADCGSN